VVIAGLLMLLLVDFYLRLIARLLVRIANAQ